MYFQCDPDADPNAMSEAEIWQTLQSRVPGTTLKEGRIFQRDVLRFAASSPANCGTATPPSWGMPPTPCHPPAQRA